MLYFVFIISTLLAIFYEIEFEFDKYILIFKYILNVRLRESFLDENEIWLAKSIEV